MFEAIFTFIVSFQFVLGIIVGVVGGMALGRNSSRANAAFDELRARAERAEEALRDLRARKG